MRTSPLKFASVLLALSAATLGGGPVLAAQFGVEQPRLDFDVRYVSEPAERSPIEPSIEQRVALDELRRSVPGATARWDEVSGTLRWVAAPPGATLSSTDASSPEAAAREFLRQRSTLFGIGPAAVDGLRLSSSVPGPNGGRHLYFRQTVAGIEVHGGRVNVAVDAHGSVISCGARLFRGLGPASEPRIDAREALSRAALDVYPDRVTTGVLLGAVDESRSDRKVLFDEPELGRPPSARLVLFPDNDGARLAWEVRLAEPSFETDYRVLINADDGRLLARHNLTATSPAGVSCSPIFPIRRWRSTPRHNTC